MAIVAAGERERVYLSPTDEQEKFAQISAPDTYPQGEMPDNPRWFSPPAFGLKNYAELFSNRQLTALTTLGDLVAEARSKVIADGGTEEYGKAIATFLSFAVDREANRLSTLCVWNRVGEKIEQTFSRQAIPMIWDFAEANIFSDSTGSWSGSLEWIPKCIEAFPAGKAGIAAQANA